MQDSVETTKIVVACEYCRFRRIRCDGLVPCSSCRVRDRDCQYPTSPPKKRGPKTKLEKARLALLAGVAGEGVGATGSFSASEPEGALGGPSNKRRTIRRARGDLHRGNSGDTAMADAEDEDGAISSALDYSQAEGPDSAVSRVGAGADIGVGKIPTSKRSSDAASTQAGSGSEGGSSLPRAPPPAPSPFAQAPLQQSRPRLPPQRRRLGGSDEVSPMGAVTFRMPGGDSSSSSSSATSGFPTPSERDMRAIDGFFAHATNFFPVVGADELYAILAAWAAGRSASGRHPAMPDHWWCAHQDAPFSSAVSMASPAVSSAPLSSAADFVLGPGGAPLLRLSPMDRAQIALYFGVLAIGYHTLRGADSRPPPDAIAVSEGCFERARLLVLTCIDAPNHYAVTTLLLLAQFSFGYLRTRAASIHASLAWRLARACGLAEDSGLGFLCSLFRHYMCEDLEQLPVPPRLLPRAASLLQPPDRGGSSDAGSAPAPSSSPATCSSPTPPPVLVVPTLAQPPASGAAAPQPSTWSQLASPSPSLAAPPAIAIGGGDGGIGGARPVSQQLSPVVAELAAPCEALAPREIDDAYVAAAALCGGRLTINGTSDGTAKTPPSADGRSAELHLRYLDQRVSLLLVVVVSRMSLLRRGLSNLVNKREVWRLADELVEISALPGAAMPLARLANIYGLKAITARQAGQHSHAQVWAIAAIGLWRRVPVTHIAQNFVVGFIARHTALIALSSELQAAAAAFMGGEAGSSSGASSGATSRSGVDSSVPSSRSAASSLGVTHAAASAAALQAGGPERGGLPADTGRASSSGGFDMPSEREAAVVSTGLPPLHEYRHFAAIALMFAAVAHFWPAHARSFTGLLAEATAMLQGANESLARTLGLPAFRAPTPASTTARSLQSFASSSGGDSSTRAADVTAAAASPSPDDMQGGGGMSGSGARREVGGGARALSGGPSEKWGIRRFGDPPARSVPARGESLMTSLVLESDAAGAPQSGSQAAVATRGKARVLASPLDLLCMVVRKEQPLAVPPQQLPQAAPPPFYAEAAAAALLPPLGGQLEPASSFFYGSGGGRGVGGNGSSSLGAIGDMTMRSMSGDLTTRVAAGPLPGVGGQLQAPTLPQSLLVGGQGLDMGGLHHQPQQPQQQRFGGAGEATSGPLGAMQEHDSDDYDDDFSDDGGADVAGREWLQLGGPQQQHRPHASSESAAAAASAHRAAAGSKRPRDSSGGVHPSSGATASSNAASRLLPPPPQHNVPMLRLGGGSGGGGLSLSSSGAFLPDTARGSGSGLDSARGAMGSLSVAAPFLGPPTARLTEAPPPLMGGGSVGGGGHEVAAARGTANGTSQGAPLAPWHAEADDLAM